MIKDILDREGNVIGFVNTVRNDIMYQVYGDSCGVEMYDNLSLSDFSGKNLENADFHGMDLFSADFRYCNLKGADFRGANVGEAHFYDANLENADFRGADLSGTMYEKDAEERKIIYDKTTKFRKHHTRRYPSWM